MSESEGEDERAAQAVPAAPGDAGRPRGGRASQGCKRACMLVLVAALMCGAVALRFSPVYAWVRDGSADSTFGDATAGPQVAGPVPSVRYNYASASCGAKIVWKKSLHPATTKPLIVHAASVLESSVDRYLYAECSHCSNRRNSSSSGGGGGACFWFVVELCQAIKVSAVAIETNELFAAYIKDFSVQGSFT